MAVLAGLGVDALGLWMLSTIGPGSALLPDVVPGILVLSLGMATFTSPLVSATFGPSHHLPGPRPEIPTCPVLGHAA